MARLTKFDAERLMDQFDTDPVAALTTALAKVLDRPDTGWASLVELAFEGQRRDELLAREPGALDALAAELNETRGLAR